MLVLPGYCDVFSNCRLVDADGPLSRLKQAIFNPELYSNIKRWIIVSNETELSAIDVSDWHTPA